MVYHGSYAHSIDSKGRINIPALHRRLATKRASVAFWFTPGVDGCIYLWDGKGFAGFAAEVAARPANHANERHDKRSIFARTVRVEPDGQGRVVIPEHLRREAGLDGEALVVGNFDRIELWKPNRYEVLGRAASSSSAASTDHSPSAEPRGT